MSYRLKIKGKTWSKVSYELFDYESLEFQNSEFTIEKSGAMVRNGPHLKFVDHKNLDESFLDESETLFNVNETDGNISQN